MREPSGASRGKKFVISVRGPLRAPGTAGRSALLEDTIVRRVLLTGGAGMLGSAVVPAFLGADDDVLVTDASSRALEHVPPQVAREVVDVRNGDRLSSVVASFRPDLVVHLAAVTDIEFCERNPDQAWSTHVVGCRNVARAARDAGAVLVAVSTSAVFDGTLNRPYIEFDPPTPLSQYGLSKAAGEAEVRRIVPECFLFRAGWMAGGGHDRDHKFVGRLIAQLRNGARKLHAVRDRIGSLTVAPSFAETMLQVLQTERYGTYHVVNSGFTTHVEIAKVIIEAVGLTTSVDVVPVSYSHFAADYSAPRPKHERLDSLCLRVEGFADLPPWDSELIQYVRRWF
jgi:dTDP-4-dehydrorhamnose reductase